MAETKKRSVEKLEETIHECQTELKRIKSEEIESNLLALAKEYLVMARKNLESGGYSFGGLRNMLVYRSREGPWGVVNPQTGTGWAVPTASKSTVDNLYFDYFAEASKFPGGYDKMAEFIEKAEKIITNQVIKIPCPIIRLK